MCTLADRYCGVCVAQPKMSRPRIAIITSRFPFGPKEAFCREEVRELARYADVYVIPALPTNEPRVEGVDPALSPRLRAFTLGTFGAGLAQFMRTPFRSLRALRAILRAPDSMSTRFRNLAIFPKALAVARFVRKNDIGHVHAYWLSAPSTIGRTVHEVTGVSWSATGHRYDLVGYNLPRRLASSRDLFSSARFVRTISQSGYERVRRGVVATTPVVLEHLGVRLVSARPGRQQTPMRCVCIAFLERVKGHEDLLRAFASARTAGAAATLTLIGDGSLRGRLEDLARELGMSGVVSFEGILPHRRVLERLASGDWDVAALTSLDEGPELREGIPVSLMECMAAGLPVIATRSGGVPELVDDATGLLCSPGDVNALASAIVALSSSPALRSEMGARARQKIEKDFNVSSAARRFAERLELTGASQMQS